MNAVLSFKLAWGFKRSWLEGKSWICERDRSKCSYFLDQENSVWKGHDRRFGPE